MMKKKCKDQIPYCASESQCDGSLPGLIFDLLRESFILFKFRCKYFGML